MEARDSITKRVKKATALKEHLAQCKKVTAGQLYRGGSCRLGSDVFQETKERIELKQKKEEDSRKQISEAYKAHCAVVKKIREKNKSCETLKSHELTALLKFKKRKSDKALPIKKKDKQELYRMWYEGPNRRDTPPSTPNVSDSENDETSNTSDEDKEDLIDI